ncbi:MAG: hypothetical protein KBE04_11220 [Phycisphaerae bacterium]|nr:hypothetical protein [Phycisphaerae bacterium]
MKALYDHPGFPDGRVRRGGHALSLNGRGQFIELPPDAADHSALMVRTTLKWSGGAAKQRIFDFANGAGNGMYLTPKGVARGGGSTLDT